LQSDVCSNFPFHTEGTSSFLIALAQAV
jgi:hypothetical protein